MAGRPIRFSILADDKDFQNATKDVSAGFDKMESEAKEAGRSIDNSLEGTAEGADTLASKGAQAAGALSGLGDVVGGPIGAGMQGLGVGMQAAADAGDLLNVAVEGGKSLLTAMGSGLGKVAKALKLDKIAKGTATAVQWAWNAAMSANPLGLIVIAIAAVVAGLVIFFTKTKLGKAIVTGVFNAIKTAVKKVSDFFTNTFIPAVKSVWNSVSTWFGKAVDFVKGMPGKVTAGARGIWHGITSGLSAVVGSYSSGGGGVKGRLWSVVNFVKGMPGKVASAASGMWNGIRDAFKNAINWIIGRWNGLSFTIPSFSAFGHTVGGGTIRVPQIPYLARGGITTGPTLAMIGDNPGGREAVIPLDRYPGLGGTTVNVTVQVTATPGTDRVALGREVAGVIGEFVRSGGRLAWA
jgi:hypothetical protein